jgi:hypothetical protein
VSGKWQNATTTQSCYGLYTDLEAAIKNAIGAAPAAPKPLQGGALQRYLDANAKVTEIVRRIKEIRTSRKPE